MATVLNVVASSNPGQTPAQPDELARLKAQFLASLNHEIRTPLSGIMGMMELMLETKLDDQQQECVSTTRSCAETLLAILNDTLEYSALSAGTVAPDETPFNLVETLKTIAAEHREQALAKGLELGCLLEDSVPEVAIGDPIQLRKLLKCLLGNAVKFTHRGRIVMTAMANRTGSGSVRFTVTISDTGIGIAEEKLELIFDPFRQLESGLGRSYSGLGLGLAIAQKLTALLGGEIHATSQAGKGSLFTLTIPLGVPVELEASVHHSPADEAYAPVVARYRVLVAEDDRISQRVIFHHLRRGGHNAVCVGSGEEAVEAAARQRFDVVLMDIQLPGMDGFEATAAIRRLPGYAGVPILALTANYGEEYRLLCLQHGMQAYLPKPVKAEQLLATIGRFLTAS